MCYNTSMPQILTPVQMQALISAPDCRTKLGKRDTALLSVMLYGGLRSAEACGLRRDEIEFDNGNTRLTFAGKGGKIRTVTLPKDAVRNLDRWLRSHESDYVFPGRLQDGNASVPLATRSARRIIKQAATKAGLPDWVHCHTLRHCFGSTVMRKTGDLYLTSRVMGHSKVDTTARHYIAYDKRYADEAAKVW